MATLRVNVPVKALARLLEETERSPNKLQIVEKHISDGPVVGASRRVVERYVDFARPMPGQRRFAERNTEVTLELRETYHTVDPDELIDGIEVKVGREMLDALCDVIGIYPRSGRLPDKVREAVGDLHNAISFVGTIADNTVYVDGSISGQQWGKLLVGLKEVVGQLATLEEVLKEQF